MSSKDSEKPDGDGSQKDYSDAERQFLAHQEEPDEFDEELRELIETRERGSVLRPILMIIVILMIGSVISGWGDELEYFFSSWEPVQVGDTAAFSEKAAADPDWEPPLNHNTYVSMEGLPTRMTTGGNYKFFRLLGAEVYVQLEQEETDDEDDTHPLLEDQESLPERNMAPGLLPDEQRQFYSGEGRLISFAADPELVRGIKRFYGERYNMQFCEDFVEHQIEDMEQQLLERIRNRWQQRYEEADNEERERRGLTPEPTAEEEQQLLERDPVCVNAYLLQDGQRPVDRWWYLLFTVLLGGFAVYTAFKLVRWFQDWLKP